MTLTARVAATFLLLALTPTARPQSEPLGRLFFTPEQRAVLDRQRLADQLPGGSASKDGAAYTINGIVKRSSGRQTTWINGTPIDNGVRLTGKGAPLKAGETVHTNTGEREDLLNGGEIVVKRSAQKSAPK